MEDLNIENRIVKLEIDYANQSQKLLDMCKVVFGNGEPGIINKLQKLETRFGSFETEVRIMNEQNKENAEFMRKVFIWVLAVALGGSGLSVLTNKFFNDNSTEKIIESTHRVTR